MRRTTIDLDQHKLDQVREVLGTTGIRETVDRAFDEVLRSRLRQRLAARLVSGVGIDRGPDILDASRKWTTE